MKLMLAGLGAVAGALTVVAQSPAVDQGIAGEVARLFMRESTSQALFSNTNLVAQYNNLALEQELVQESARRGLDERLDVHQSLNAARRNILIQALRNEVVKQASAPTEEEIKAGFDRFSDQLILPEAQLLDVYTYPESEMEELDESILVLKEDAEKAEEFLIEKGFNHLTAGFSEPWFTPSQVSTSVWPELVDMESGDVDSFPDGAGLLLIRKMGEREARSMTLEEGRDLVSGQLLRENQEKLWNAYIEKSRAALAPVPVEELQ